MIDKILDMPIRILGMSFDKHFHMIGKTFDTSFDNFLRKFRIVYNSYTCLDTDSGSIRNFDYNYTNLPLFHHPFIRFNHRFRPFTVGFGDCI